MIAHRIKHTLFLAATTVIVALAVLATGTTVAGATPIASKFVLSSHFGWEVDQTTGGDICTVASKDVCRPGKESSRAGGFSYPTGVAVDNDPESPDYGDMYVTDANDRAQELTATGAFVRMFGGDVNETTGGDICSEQEIASSGVKCKTGVNGTAAGEFGSAKGVAVDPDSGDVYVLDESNNSRVQEFTASGEFVLMIGGEVNETKDLAAGASEAEKDLCTAASHDVCKAGVKAARGSAPHSAFDPNSPTGNTLAMGGPEDLLYVADEHRVQEFTAAGEWHGEISLASISSESGWDVQALAVSETGDVYLDYTSISEGGGPTIVYEFNPAGAQIAEIAVTPSEVNPSRREFRIMTLALDPYGRLGVVTREWFYNDNFEKITYTRGVLYSSSGVKISEFAPPSGTMSEFPFSLAFSASDELYVTEENFQDVEAYAPALFPETVTCPAEDVGATSATLCGEINPNGLSTRGFFDYGPPTGAQTPVVFEGDGIAFEQVRWPLTGLVPNETYGFKVLAEAEVAGEQVPGVGGEVRFHTATPPPEVPAEAQGQVQPYASFVRSQAVVLNARVNPEHATTRYHFEYGQCPGGLVGCASVQSTPDEESSLYGTIGFTQEVSGLQPQSAYRYRLVANNEHEEAGKTQGGQTGGQEGVFTTAAAPEPRALTGAVSGVGTSSAMVSGTVNPDGQAATYSFELGVYNSAGTQYGVVFSGAAGAGTVPVGEALMLTGLQPGTTYTYRVEISSGYGAETGQAVLFTTAGLPEVLVSPVALPLLAVPAIAFPTEAKASTTTKKATPKCKKGKKLSHNRCVKVKAKKKVRKSTSHKTGKKN